MYFRQRFQRCLLNFVINPGLKQPWAEIGERLWRLSCAQSCFTDRPLPIVRYRSPVTDRPLPIARYRSAVTDRPLPIGRYRSAVTGRSYWAANLGGLFPAGVYRAAFTDRPHPDGLYRAANRVAQRAACLRGREPLRSCFS